MTDLEMEARKKESDELAIAILRFVEEKKASDMSIAIVALTEALGSLMGSLQLPNDQCLTVVRLMRSAYDIAAFNQAHPPTDKA